MKATAVAVACLVCSAAAAADPEAIVARRARGAVHLDGHLDEAEWKEAPAFSRFVESFPRAGVPASLPTEVRVLYDDSTLYVGVRCADPEPAAIVRQLARRDSDVVSDRVEVAIDSGAGGRTAYVFSVNAAGVQRDELVFADVNTTDAWDAVWGAAVAVDGQGWSAELAIPFRQLRFSAAAEQRWRVVVRRFIPRTHQVLGSALIPRDANPTKPGGLVVSRFGRIEGLVDVDPPRALELLPYLAARATMRPKYSDPARPHPRTVDPLLDLGLDRQGAARQGADAHRRGEPRLRAGRDGSGDPEPLDGGAVLPGEAAVLPRGARRLPAGGERVRHAAAAVLLAADWPRRPHPRRREGHGRRPPRPRGGRARLAGDGRGERLARAGRLRPARPRRARALRGEPGPAVALPPPAAVPPRARERAARGAPGHHQLPRGRGAAAPRRGGHGRCDAHRRDAARAALPPARVRVGRRVRGGGLRRARGERARARPDGARRVGRVRPGGGIAGGGWAGRGADAAGRHRAPVRRSRPRGPHALGEAGRRAVAVRRPVRLRGREARPERGRLPAVLGLPVGRSRACTTSARAASAGSTRSRWTTSST